MLNIPAFSHILTYKSTIRNPSTYLLGPLHPRNPMESCKSLIELFEGIRVIRSFGSVGLMATLPELRTIATPVLGFKYHTGSSIKRGPFLEAPCKGFYKCIIWVVFYKNVPFSVFKTVRHSFKKDPKRDPTVERYPSTILKCCVA